MGYAPAEHHESAVHETRGRLAGSVTQDGDWILNASLSVKPGLADRVASASAEPVEHVVYDIVNAGPRQRFVVLGSNGPFIVHNCCQHIARCVIAWQMVRVARRYRVVSTVHDSIGIITLEDEVEEARAYLERCMRTTPPWAAGLPLDCESGYGKSYGDC